METEIKNSKKFTAATKAENDMSLILGEGICRILVSYFGTNIPKVQ